MGAFRVTYEAHDVFYSFLLFGKQQGQMMHYALHVKFGTYSLKNHGDALEKATSGDFIGVRVSLRIPLIILYIKLRLYII